MFDISVTHTHHAYQQYTPGSIKVVVTQHKLGQIQLGIITYRRTVCRIVVLQTPLCLIHQPRHCTLRIVGLLRPTKEAAKPRHGRVTPPVSNPDISDTKVVKEANDKQDFDWYNPHEAPEVDDCANEVDVANNADSKEGGHNDKDGFSAENVYKALIKTGEHVSVDEKGLRARDYNAPCISPPIQRSHITLTLSLLFTYIDIPQSHNRLHYPRVALMHILLYFLLRINRPVQQARRKRHQN
jgi:hypothetical protein